MAVDRHEKAWVFDFALEAKAGHRLVRYSEVEEVMEKIHAWAASRGLRIGGGFRVPTDEGKNVNPFAEDS
jgi:hypothetical protein